MSQPTQIEGAQAIPLSTNQAVRQHQQPQYIQPQQQYQQPPQAQMLTINIGGNNANRTQTYDAALLNCCSAGCCVCTSAFICGHGVLASARTKYDGSNNCLNSWCIGPVGLRNIIREGYGIRGDCCTDCMVVTCCGPCAAIQTYNEVQVRGPIRQAM